MIIFGLVVFAVCRRRWTNIKPTLDQRRPIVFGGIQDNCSRHFEAGIASTNLK